ncbi:MAG: hypothetical protein WBA44_00020 [Mesorhizobium sp.]
MSNFFDQFDTPTQQTPNFFDQFDGSAAAVQPKGELKAVEPSFAQSLGNKLYDAANALGLPASRMRDDAGMVDAAVRGAADTASFGMSDEIAAALGAATGIGGQFGDYEGNLGAQRTVDTRDAAFNPGARLVGQIAGGMGTGAALGRAGLSLTGRAAASGRSLPTVAAASSAEGAAYGGAYGFGSGDDLDDRLDQTDDAALMGAILGPVATVAGEGAARGLRRIATPFTASPERLAAARALQAEGVDLSAGQVTGSKLLRYAESEIGGGTAADLAERQGEQFTSAALRRAGVQSNRATPDVVDQAFTDIGQRFDDLGQRNTLVPDQQLTTDMQAALNAYGSLVPESMRAPIVQNVADDLFNAFRTNGAMRGEAYQVARSKLDRAARAAKSDPQLAEALRGMRSALDDGMERSIAASNPADLGAWREARTDYRNLLTVQHAAGGAGEAAAGGIISPAQLRAATVSKNGRGGYARGRGDHSDLARAGEQVMKTMPSSGTTERSTVRNLGLPLATSGAGVWLGGLPGMLAGAAAPKVVGATMMSRPGQAYLSNQMFAGDMSPAYREMMDAILTVGAGAAAGNEGADDELMRAILRDDAAQRRAKRDGR